MEMEQTQERIRHFVQSEKKLQKNKKSLNQIKEKIRLQKVRKLKEHQILVQPRKDFDLDQASLAESIFLIDESRISHRAQSSLFLDGQFEKMAKNSTKESLSDYFEGYNEIPDPSTIWYFFCYKAI